MITITNNIEQTAANAKKRKVAKRGRWDSFWAGLCGRCKGTLTSADYEAGECTQCGKVLR